MKRILVLTILVLPLLGAGAPATKPNPSRALAAVLAEYDRYELENDPLLRIQQGLPVKTLPDSSYEGEGKRTAFYRSLRERLARIDPKGLSHEEWLSREILDSNLSAFTEGFPHFWDFFQITPYSAPFRPLHEVFTGFSFKTVQDRDRYLDLLRQYARIIGQLQTNLETQRDKGVLLPKAEIDAVVGLVRSFIRKPEESLFAVGSDRLQRFYPEGAVAFQEKVRQIVATAVNPALEALAAVPDAKSYRDAAPERVGIGQYPGGQAAYQYLVALHTTMTGLTPKEIHERGLREVAGLNARLEEVRKKVGFEGDLAAFRRFLKTDARFFVKTPDEVAARLTAPLRRIEPRIPDFFGRVPKAPYGVARLAPELEAGMTYGYYQRPLPGHPEGDYIFNGSKLEERSLLTAASLAYHELVPGHHFQIALQIENQRLPLFRKNSYPTAFIEGWAMYASGVAGEMGGYADPYDLAGTIAQDLFLSSRLVVDTGMNSLGWTRQQAIDYLRENTFESDTQIGTEILRYAVDMPGQALAYKMGSNRIWELRRKAEGELGKKFDLRRFHDAVLGSGSMPMTVLEKHVDWWIGEEKKR